MIRHTKQQSRYRLAAMRHPRYELRVKYNAGFTLVELLISVFIAGILIVGLGNITSQALDTYAFVQDRNKLTAQARFAMDHMVRAVDRSRHVVLPSPENTNTAWPESVREFPPRLAYPLESAVLAFLLDPSQDLDANGIADADNDGDGKIDEDPGGDSNFDLASGLYAIDDDNDGLTDEQQTLIWPGANLGPTNEDDDEDDYANEDLIDGLDNDGDGKLDEDIKKQTDGNDLSGVAGVDDDGDGSIDTDNKNDDDEDGSENEDWYDTAVYYLNSGNLLLRLPVPWDEDLSGTINGRDYVVKVIANNVTGFRVERVVQTGNRSDIIDITLELTSTSTAETSRLTTRVRVGGAL